MPLCDRGDPLLAMRIREVREDDVPAVKGLLREGFDIPGEIADRYLDMWWRRNPWKTEAIARGWLLEDDQGDAAGFFGNIPVPYQIDGRRRIAVAGTSLYVQQTVRGIFGLRLIAAFIQQHGVPLLLNNTPSETVRTICLQNGFLRATAPSDLEYWWVRRLDEVVDFAKEKERVPRSLLWILGPSLALTRPLLRRFRASLGDPRTNVTTDARYQWSPCTECDHAFTDLWQRCKDDHAVTLYRDAETLEWLCFSEAVASKRHLLRCKDLQTNEMVGYVVWDLERSHGGVDIMRLKDAFLPNVNADVVGTLIEYVKTMASEHDVAAVVFWAATEEMGALLSRVIRLRRRYTGDYLFRYVNHVALAQPGITPCPLDPDNGAL